MSGGQLPNRCYVNWQPDELDELLAVVNTRPRGQVSLRDQLVAAGYRVGPSIPLPVRPQPPAPANPQDTAPPTLATAPGRPIAPEEKKT